MARLLPALAGVRLQPAFEMKLNGPMDRLDVDMNVRSSAGQIAGHVLTDVMMPGQSMTGDLSVRHLNLAPIVGNSKQKSDITGSAHVDVHGPAFSDLNSLRGDVTLNAPRVVAAGYVAEQVKAKVRFAGRQVEVDGGAAAYGARMTAAGRAHVAGGKQPLAYDARASAARRSPTVAGRLEDPAGRNQSQRRARHVRLERDLHGDARFERRPSPGRRLPRAAPPRSPFVATRWPTRRMRQNHVDLQHVGEAFQIPALAVDSYKPRSTVTSPRAVEAPIRTPWS